MSKAKISIRKVNDRLRGSIVAYTIAMGKTLQQTISEVGVMTAETGANVIPQAKKDLRGGKRIIRQTVFGHRHGVPTYIEGSQATAPGDRVVYAIKVPYTIRNKPISQRTASIPGKGRHLIFEGMPEARQWQTVTGLGVGKAGFWTALLHFGKSIPAKYAKFSALSRIGGLTEVDEVKSPTKPSISITNKSRSIGTLAAAWEGVIKSKVNNRLQFIIKHADVQLDSLPF